jgi:D-glycerate 3-kinase
MISLEALIVAHGLPPAYGDMVEAVHRPVAHAIAARRRQLDRPIVAGLCGSQGSGKSTMAAFLVALLAQEGLSAAILSIDDLYLTLEQRGTLARDVHPLLRTRGVPGTHDVGLGHALLDVLCGDTPVQASMPWFDKAEDTRAPWAAWPVLNAPVDVVIFEGWCVGAAPQAEDALAEPINALEREEDADGRWRRYVNDRLRGDYAALFARIDILALLLAPGFEAVYAWRRLQEEKLAARVAAQGGQGRSLMDPAQIARFLMFYERITRHVLVEAPPRADIVMPLTADHRIEGVRMQAALKTSTGRPDSR